MRKALLVLVAIALVGGLVLAAGPAKDQKFDGALNAAGNSGVGEALETIDYWNTSSVAYYTWGGDFYMSNLFKPQAGWYPLDVVAVEVWPYALDNNTATGAAGVLNGVAVFDPAGAILARELAVNAQVKTWTNIPLTSPPRISTGNFYAGMWNSNVGAGNRNDAGYQCTATGWTAPPTEPYECITSTAASPTAGSAGPWAGNGCGATYGTVSAASIRAQVNTNVPVELMSFSAE